MKKITFLVAALCATTLAFASTATITPAAIGNKGASTRPYQSITYTVGDVTLSIDSAFCNGTQLRVYAGAKVVFTSDNNISKIDITTELGEDDGKKDKYSASALSGTGYATSTGSTSGVWTGNAKTVTLTASAQCRMLKVVVTTDGDGEDAGKIDTLTVTIAEALTVTNALTDGAVAPNYYILSGTVSDLDLNTKDYGNATFTLTDATGNILVFRAYNLGNVKFTATSQLANGDEVKVLGQLQKYVKDGATTPELVKGYLVERNGSSDGGDEDGDATELTVNYAQALYFADYSSEGAYNWTIDLVNETSDEDYDVWMSIDLTTPTQTKLAGTWTTSNGLSIEYSTLDLINGTDTTYLDATNVTLTLKCTGKDDEGYAIYDVVATMVCDDGKTYTVKENLTVYAFDYDTDDEITLEDEITAIHNIEVLNDVYAREGHIYAEEGAQIYTVMGLNVTEQNQKSTLGEGIYIVKAGNKLAKIVVK